MKKIVFMLLAIAVVASLAAMLAGCGGSAAADPKSIIVYTALEDAQLAAYLASFKTQHPDIDVKIVRDSTGIITAKLLAEKGDPVADVAWGIAATSLLVCDQNSMLEPYSPQGVDRVQASFKDKNSPTHWVGIDAWMTAFVVNAQEAAKAGVPIPRSYADLLDPKYKGMIVMPAPWASGTGFMAVSGWLQTMGQDKGWQYMKDLDKNILYYVDSGSEPAVLASTGKCVVGISFDYRGITLKQQGAPVEVVFPSEKSGWDVEANALIKKKSINPSAKIFLDWAISDPAMQEYSKNYPITAVKITNPIPQGYPADPTAQLAINDLYWAASNRESILKQWGDSFAAKVRATTTTAAPAATTPPSS